MWEGCSNVRDLGGLPSRQGETRPGVVVRADNVAKLTAEGWAAARRYGVRTIIDLRSKDEFVGDRDLRPIDFCVRHLPVEDLTSTEFWDTWRPELGTPGYFAAFLKSFPDRTASVGRTIIESRDGGIVIHCGLGRDRTGIVSLVLLALAGVEAALIAEDYLCSLDVFPASPYVTEQARCAQHSRAREVLLDTLAAFDVLSHLRAGGLADSEIATLRDRLVRERSEPLAGSATGGGRDRRRCEGGDWAHRSGAEFLGVPRRV